MMERKIKIIVSGDSGVGKSSFIKRFTENVFDDHFIATIGIDFHIKRIKMDEDDENSYKLHIWDLAGQERFKSIVNTYYRNGQGILLMYDITNIKSFDNLTNWLRDIRRYAPDNAVIFLIGTKIDQIESRKISFEKAEKFAKENNIEYYEVSSKTEEKNIDDIFYILTLRIQDEIEKQIILDAKKKKEICLENFRQRNKKCCS